MEGTASISIRSDFPILTRKHNDKPLIYLDSAATTQKPDQVIDAISNYYKLHNANVHRAAHILAEEATTMMEQARVLCQAYIGAGKSEEVIFTRGTTESINLVANCIAHVNGLGEGDEILITEMEHHSNIVPWQLLAARTGASLIAANVTPAGDLNLDDLYAKLSGKTKVLALNHVSNALGTINPVRDIIDQARRSNVVTVVDGAQAALHQDINVQELGCDFYAFSGHKMFGPTGIGVLYGRLELLESMPPWHGGGEMIETVRIEVSTFQAPPHKFEAGTPNIAGIVGLGAAIEYLNTIPRLSLVEEEDRLIKTALSGLRQIPGVRLVGEPENRSAVISFTMDGAHPNDVGTLLNQQGVAVRTGHHCTMPLMEALGHPGGTVRASFSLYSSQEDVERLLLGVEKTTSFL